MKLGIINGWSEGCIKYVHEKGLEAVEFCVNDNYDSAEFLSKAYEIKGYSEKYNVAVGSMGRWGMTRIDENGEIIPEALQADKNIIIAELSNGSFGCYLPIDEAIEQGGYEPTITGATTPEPKIGTDMVNATVDMLDSKF